MTPRHLLLVVADGIRPEVLAEEIDAGHAPALAALRARGGLHAVSTVFPSVTGPAYVPFLMGRHPAPVGLPGLRWYDRARSLRWSPAQARSYAGVDIWHVDRDVHAEPPTLLELAQPSLAGMSMLARGATHGRVGRSLYWMLRAAPSHFRGDLAGWRTVEQAATRAFFRRFARARPRSAVLALTIGDKRAHAEGPFGAGVREAVTDVDAAVATARAIAEAGGWGERLHVWVVADHGHAPVAHHDDLHGWLEGAGWRVLAHPRLSVRRPDVALMVGGNAMAQLYVDPAVRTRGWWPALGARGARLLEALVQRPSVDLAMVAPDAHTVRVTHAGRGTAEVVRRGDGRAARWDYLVRDGDPLGLGGTLRGLSPCTAWEACAATDYPDSVVQLSLLASAPRTGDVILSAREGWDLRARFEPVAHVSTHGALLRAQMQVPLLVDVPVARAPQRTADVVPSACTLLGVGAGVPFDGRCFLSPPA